MKSGLMYHVADSILHDRPPMQMINHGVWAPGLRDEFNVDFDGQPVLVDGEAVTRFQWLAAQRLPSAAP